MSSQTIPELQPELPPESQPELPPESQPELQPELQLESQPPEQAEAPIGAGVVDTLLESVMLLCEYYGVGRSAEALCAGLPKGRVLEPSLALTALASAGLTGGLVRRRVQELSSHLMPLILLRNDRGAAILTGRRMGEDRKPIYQLVMPEISNEIVEISLDELNSWYAGHAILVKPQAKIDTRAGEETERHAGHWLFVTLWRYRRFYYSAALGALLINVLGLASIFFTMNVYDRVVPNQAYTTLWSLAIGVVFAMMFEAVSRYVRAHLLDVAGKKADLVMGTTLFRQALSIQMEHKPASSGSFANQLREFESVRDFATSATLSAVSDLPFVILFCGVIFMVGGPLGFVPLLLIPIIIGISIWIQWPLARTMQENLRESSLKQGVLIESVEGLETLKSVGGEGYMQRRWEAFSAAASSTAMKSRMLSSMAMNMMSFLQQLQTVVLVVAGVYLIGEGTLTQGALIGTVMLAGRAVAPLNQVAGLAVRFQQAKAALSSLNRLMAMPVDRDPNMEYLAKPPLNGQLTLKDISFSYPAPPMKPNPQVLKNISTSIKAGERVAILGRIGSGKSTLLRLMARLYAPVGGQMLTDGLDVSQIDPADWRKAVGYVGQEARLFYGTLRENIMIGRPDAPAEEFLSVLRLTGLDAVAAKHPLGINLPIGEAGEGLSGGQRQLVALARCLLVNPQLILLDEPTSAMDTQTEALFMEHLVRATRGHTLVIVTHRPSLLSMVERILVVDDGKLVADGPKQQIMAALGANSAANAANVSNVAGPKAAAEKKPAAAQASLQAGVKTMSEQKVAS
ncbi:MAG: transporter related protein [Collimonas fungivorans]|uniref:type I secretion system permease/ATPase n=1 Tax=Collimonas fungivorans TaxID=158899 RepID=UPI0026F2BE63|nr:type I secretion system permease/ATPase [Collimonas fungivorans]MDB5766434.1 transporter related protein [Collimonas fungivorans]